MAERIVVTPEDVESDPTDTYQVTLHGDVAISSLRICGRDTGQEWLYVEYMHGGSSAGTPKHWHTFVRITGE
jgi:hypothetical protein